jgi:1,4-dihydroxy-2-naphthoate octaprenyltransferase
MTLCIILCYFAYSLRNFENVNIIPFLFVSISAVLFHLSANTISEYQDCKKGVDDKNSPGPKYRLITGIVPAKNILYIGIVSFASASILGIIAVFLSGIKILLAGLIGAGISLFYSESPFGYKYKALGEFGVFLAYGPVLCFSSIFSLAEDFRLIDFLFSIPFGLLTSVVLLANNIRDYDFDKKKIKTLVTVMGLKRSYATLFFIVNLSFLIILFLIYLKTIPKTCSIVFISYFVLLFSIKRIGTPNFVDIFGILQVLFCVFILIGFVIE